ncbi:MAG: hypothetical protein IID53_05775 [Proteobacteria bacterium]|nr:hypothetical protein [Pseudomonadota bacterium]
MLLESSIRHIPQHDRPDFKGTGPTSKGPARLQRDRPDFKETGPASMAPARFSATLLTGKRSIGGPGKRISPEVDVQDWNLSTIGDSEGKGVLEPKDETS